MKLTPGGRDNSGDKCPICLFINQNFIIVDDDLRGCRRCGAVFISKSVRESVPFDANLNKPTHEKIAEEVKHAEKVREDEKEVQEDDGGQGGQEESGADLQREAEEGAEAGDPEKTQEITCVCGKTCKNHTGLLAHQRHCGVYMEKEHERSEQLGV